MSYKVDFHIHSYFSDGTMKPTDIVRFYHENEYDMISITDHDGIDGLNEAIIAGEALKISVIPGIEFSVSEKDEIELHLLGYYFDVYNQNLNEKLKDINENRNDRNVRLLKVLHDMGYELTLEDLMQRPNQKYIGKPNFAMALKKRGYINNLNEAFMPGKFLESPEVKAVKKDKISVYEAIKLIKDAGGISVLAHPMKIHGIGKPKCNEYFENLDVLIKRLKLGGLKGIECFHPSATEEDSLKLVCLAEKYHLHITEGSDFHGTEFE